MYEDGDGDGVRTCHALYEDGGGQKRAGEQEKERQTETEKQKKVGNVRRQSCR